MQKQCDTQSLIALKQAGKSYRDIQAITGIKKDAVRRKIKDLLPTEETTQYKNLRADILAEMQRKLLMQCDDARLKKMPAASAILAACQLYDKERLERGQSTENIAQLTAAVASIKSAEMSHDVTDNGTIVCQNEDDKSTGHD